MLGRLRMGIDDCIRVYLELFETVFTELAFSHSLSPFQVPAAIDRWRLHEAF